MHHDTEPYPWGHLVGIVLCIIGAIAVQWWLYGG